jgi:c-di-GMP-binding flagellar brake protein YcgR
MTAALTQRRFRRVALNVPCAVRPLHTHPEVKINPIPAETKDISQGGMCFVGNADWEVGTEYECVLELEPGPLSGKPMKIKCRGRIVRVAKRESGHLEVGATIEHFSYAEPEE